MERLRRNYKNQNIIMKNSFLKVKHVILVLILVTTIACGKDDPLPEVNIPTVSYASPSMEAQFFKEGQSTAPTVNWNNNQGLFSLATAIEGLTINASTGVLNWTKALPEGEHAVEVIAKNSAGQTSISLTLKNALQGQFIGVFDSVEIFKVKLIADGSIEVIAGNDDSNLATGTWSVDGNSVKADYSYSHGDWSFKGTLTQTESKVTLIGDYYSGHGIIPANISGDFNVVLE